MQQAEEFFLDLKEWSGRKLNIIEKYIDGFSRILGSKFRDVYYVDGFAGKGIYDNGEKGSPVLAAEISASFRASGKPFTLHCLNVEKDTENFLNLCKETQRFGNFVQNYQGTFEENIDKILSAIKTGPTFFFIDDFGVKGTDWDALEKIIARKDSTDLWIRFDHITALRLAGFNHSDAKDAQGKLNTLQNFFGITDMNYLQTRLAKGNSPEERVNIAVQIYIEQLENTYRKFGKKDGFAAAYPIISICGQRKYHLIFACSHKKAATLASNIVNGIEETFQHEKEEYKEHSSKQMNLFSSDLSEKQIFDEKVNKLKKAILELPKNRPFTREELHHELMILNKNWFGKIGRKHLTQALKDLIGSSIPKIKFNGTPGNDETVITIIE